MFWPFKTKTQQHPTPAAPTLPATPILAEPRPGSPANAADTILVRRMWNDYLRHFPDLTPYDFLDKLERRHRFFAEERAEREQKLAACHASIPRPL